MFTDNIKTHRINRGLSQEKLAEIAGINLRTVQRLESGETEPRGDTVIRLADAMNVTPGDLLNCNKKDDTSYLKALNISAFSFLLFPLLGILLPFILWITKKDQINDVDHVGKQVINFQITWNLLLFAGLVGYTLWSRHMMASITEVSASTPTIFFSTFFLIFGLLYFYNLLVTTINVFRANNRHKTWFHPKINVIR